MFTFHCVETFVSVATGQQHFTETAFAQHAQKFEIHRLQSESDTKI